MRPLHRPKVWVCKCIHCRTTDRTVRRGLKRGERQVATKLIEREAAQN